MFKDLPLGINVAVFLAAGVVVWVAGTRVAHLATFAAILAIAVTALFIAGLLERRHVMILRMGGDSLLVLATYAAGLTVLYTLR
ncbi:hypothetical protein [Aromatoleum aromaticum]|uniref:hypothetical protein n=1 Tax=Aromatoleum aromaticum TaxID=551760 RepID=UPI00145929A6|nr:hypothetical protein [Aromatoleum aromaticum]NMG56107.1 hypothetical protein [Aromatoleum aromaticum]